MNGRREAAHDYRNPDMRAIELFQREKLRKHLERTDRRQVRVGPDCRWTRPEWPPGVDDHAEDDE